VKLEDRHWIVGMGSSIEAMMRKLENQHWIVGIPSSIEVLSCQGGGHCWLNHGNEVHKVGFSVDGYRLKANMRLEGGMAGVRGVHNGSGVWILHSASLM
jgi:hypothetical protein